MSSISKDTAYKVARSLVLPTRVVIMDMEKEFSLKVYGHYQDQIPEIILQAYNVRPDWFTLTQQVRLRGNGFNGEAIDIEKDVICNSGEEADLNITNEMSKELSALDRKIEKKKKECDKLETETRAALLALRSYRKIIEAIPQAEQFLPKEGTLALTINLDSVKKRLENQIQITSVSSS